MELREFLQELLNEYPNTEIEEFDDRFEIDLRTGLGASVFEKNQFATLEECCENLMREES